MAAIQTTFNNVRQHSKRVQSSGSAINMVGKSFFSLPCTSA